MNDGRFVATVVHNCATSANYSSELEQTFSSVTFLLLNHMRNSFVEKKIPQPLVAADNASDQLAINNVAKSSSGTLLPLMFIVVLEKKIL